MKTHDGVPEGCVFFTNLDLRQPLVHIGTHDLAQIANQWLYCYLPDNREVKTIFVMAEGDCIYHPSFRESDLEPLRMYLAGYIDGNRKRERK